MGEINTSDAIEPKVYPEPGCWKEWIIKKSARMY
jgi:hypothetical protein